jgi:L-lysine exporter family protein LysE/ArgO
MPLVQPMMSGFALGGGLIVAIGAQNAYLLRMGLARQHVGLLAATAAALDGLLIVAGLLGLGALIKANPALAQAMRWGGALFLLGYGLLAAKRAWQGGSLETQGAVANAVSARAALGTLLGLSLLNPHVYLDTVVLVGAIGARHAGSAKAWFGLGAVTASVVWFFSLAYGARFLAPWLATRRAWQVLDGLIALTMLALAASLILG